MIPKPIRRAQVKRRRTGPARRSSRIHNPAYLEFLRGLPCYCCYREAYEFLVRIGGESGFIFAHTLYGRQKSDTEAAHVGFAGKPRGMSQKCSDIESIPLCGHQHHREGPESIHKMGPAAFFAHHGADRDSVIRTFQKLYAEHCR